MFNQELESMLVQMKWHVDPWIKHLEAIYFPLYSKHEASILS